MSRLEALNKKLYYVTVNPLNSTQIEHASLQEREGFGTGVDPQELPEVIAYIAEHGTVWLQYVKEKEEGKPTGVIELIPLKKALGFKPSEIETQFDINASPLKIITENQESAFSSARRFADDEDLVYHHGIAMSRRGKGYGTKLLRHALRQTPELSEKFITCYIDAAQVDEETGELKPAANESSYTVHMKAGFALVGVTAPPVYDDSITYYTVLRPSKQRPFKYKGTTEKVRFYDSDSTTTLNATSTTLTNAQQPTVIATINAITQLTQNGFVGVEYDRQPMK